VSRSRLIWVTETPEEHGAHVGGATVRAPGWRQSRPGARQQAQPGDRKGSCQASCVQTPRRTPQPRARMGSSSRGASQRALAMIARLSSTGREGGDPEALMQVERRPRQGREDDKELRRAASGAAVPPPGPAAPASAAKPGAKTRISHGGGQECRPGSGPGVPRPTPLRLASRRSSSALPPWRLGLDTAPAPGRWRRRPRQRDGGKRFGILKATKKASVPASAPKRRAIRRSRAKPRRRDSRVLPPTLVREADQPGHGASRASAIRPATACNQSSPWYFSSSACWRRASSA
jgi:hypothetical protein